VVEAIAHRVLGDLAIDQPHFAVFNLGVGIVERDKAVAQAFHFSTNELEPALDSVKYFILVESALVTHDHVHVFFLLLLGLRHGALASTGLALC
jgi:hypothetical protein